MRDLLILIGVIVVLFFMWLSIGGYSREETEGKFLRPPAPIDTGERYDAKVFERERIREYFEPVIGGEE